MELQIKTKEKIAADMFLNTRTDVDFATPAGHERNFSLEMNTDKHSQEMRPYALKCHVMDSVSEQTDMHY